MSNQIVVPAYMSNQLAVGQKSALSAAASGGVGGASPYPKISVKQSRWRLQDVEGEETVVKSFAIEFGVVSINPAVTKTFYEKKYNPGDEPAAPDCASDNGIVPNQDIAEPVHNQCATCPMNVWGSDTNPNNGKQLKRCKDSKHLGVMFLSNENLQNEYDPKLDLYSWRLSAMSMINFSNFAKQLTAQGGALDFVIIKAEFDETAEYPLINFSVSRNMSEPEYRYIEEARKGPDAKLVVGWSDEKPVQFVERVKPAAAAPAPAAQPEKQMSDLQRQAEPRRAAAAAAAARQHMQAAPTQEQVEKQEAAIDVEKARKTAALRAALAELEGTGDGSGDITAASQTLHPDDNPERGQGHQLNNHRDPAEVTDVVARPVRRQRSPVNVVEPESTSPQMDDLLSKALAGG